VIGGDENEGQDQAKEGQPDPAQLIELLARWWEANPLRSDLTREEHLDYITALNKRAEEATPAIHTDEERQDLEAEAERRSKANPPRKLTAEELAADIEARDKWRHDRRVDNARGFEQQLRDAARGVMAERGVSQAALARELGVSQSSVSHAFTDRQHGLTVTEVFWIETLAEVRPGTVYERAGYAKWPDVAEVIYNSGISRQTAAALVAAINAAREHALREHGPREDRA
jgi:hypothetical protein